MKGKHLAAALAGAASLVIFVVLLLSLRKPGAPLTRARLDAARKTWAGHGPSAYRMEIEIRGVQENRYEVRVGPGRLEVLAAGKPVRQDVAAYWTVEGMFGQLERELENSESPMGPYGVRDSSQVVLRVDFAESGLPRRFLRHVSGQTRDIEWEVVRFE